jgi:hypothetical protein
MQKLGAQASCSLERSREASFSLFGASPKRLKPPGVEPRLPLPETAQIALEKFTQEDFCGSLTNVTAS